MTTTISVSDAASTLIAYQKKVIAFSLFLVVVTAVSIAAYVGVTPIEQLDPHTHGEKFVLDATKNKAFPTVFPVYYRALGLMIFGVWCWAFNLQYLSKKGIPVYALLFPAHAPLTPPSSTGDKLSRSEDHDDADEKTIIEFASTHIRPLTPKQPPKPPSFLDFPAKPAAISLVNQSYIGVYYVGAMFTIVFCADLLLFTSMRNSMPSTVLPLVLYGTVVVLLINPLNWINRDQRFSFVNAVWHAFIAPFDNVFFMDIVIMDILTSYAKVFGDMEIILCMILKSEDYHFHRAEYYDCIVSFTPMILTGIPFVLRFLHCLRQFHSERHFSHIANALKYCTALSVIFFSGMKRMYADTEQYHTFTNAWIFCVVLNTAYSFFWDVVYDWSLFQKGSFHFLLRDTLLLGPSSLYYVAILWNLLLRCAWSFKLSSHVFLGKEFSVFVFEIIEIIRRCCWVFFRVETQYIKVATSTSSTSTATTKSDEEIAL